MNPWHLAPFITVQLFNVRLFAFRIYIVISSTFCLVIKFPVAPPKGEWRGRVTAATPPATSSPVGGKWGWGKAHTSCAVMKITPQ